MAHSVAVSMMMTKKRGASSVGLLIALLVSSCSPRRISGDYPVGLLTFSGPEITVFPAEKATVDQLVDLRLFGEFFPPGVDTAIRKLKAGEQRQNEFGSFGLVRQTISSGEESDTKTFLFGYPKEGKASSVLCPQLLRHVTSQTREIRILYPNHRLAVQVFLDKFNVTRMNVP